MKGINLKSPVVSLMVVGLLAACATTPQRLPQLERAEAAGPGRRFSSASLCTGRNAGSRVASRTRPRALARRR